VTVRRRRKKTKNRHAGSAPVAAAPNDVWAIDFCFDATTDGRAIKITNIVDEHTRESLDGPIDRSVDADKLVDHLDKLAAVRGFPRYLRCDNGPELISNALADWAKDRTEKEKTTITFIEPGAPWQNPWVESFNSRMRDECLEINDFGTMLEARVIIGDWRHAYNHDRPHSSLHYQAPAAYAATCTYQPQRARRDSNAQPSDPVHGHLRHVDHRAFGIGVVP